jgi:hypothetical protein
MPNLKISQLTNGNPAQSTDLIPIARSGANFSITVGSIQKQTAAIQFAIDGSGSTPGTGVKGQISIPVACTITGWVLTADQSGSAVIDVLRSTYSGFPTTASIAGTDKPTLSSAQKAEDLTLSGWGSTAINAGDIMQFSLSSATTVTRLNLTINVTIP